MEPGGRRDAFAHCRGDPGSRSREQKKRIMVQKAQARDGRREPAPKAPAGPLEGAFKPLGIPALAAAVNAANRQPRKSIQRDLPAILRDDDFSD